MSISDWMNEFDNATKAWFERLDAIKDDRLLDTYSDLLNEQPTIEPYLNLSADRQQMIDTLTEYRNEARADGYNDGIESYQYLINLVKRQVFVLRILHEAFPEYKINYIDPDTEPDGRITIIHPDENCCITLDLYPGYEFGPMYFAKVINGRKAERQDCFYLISDFVKFMTPYIRESQYSGEIDNELYNSAINGDLDAIKSKHKSDILFNCSVMDLIAYSGNLDAIKWLHENRTEGCSAAAMKYAAIKGHFEVVKWLYENRTEGYIPEVMHEAVKIGQLDILKYLYQKEPKSCSRGLVYIGLSYRKMNVVEFLLPLYPKSIIYFDNEEYARVLPFIQKKIANTFNKIKNEITVREFLTKKLVYHPSSSYMKRVAESF